MIQPGTSIPVTFQLSVSWRADTHGQSRKKTSVCVVNLPPTHNKCHFFGESRGPDCSVTCEGIFFCATPPQIGLEKLQIDVGLAALFRSPPTFTDAGPFHLHHSYGGPPTDVESVAPQTCALEHQSHENGLSFGERAEISRIALTA